MKKAMLIVNPSSGGNQAEEQSSYLTSIIKNQYDEITIKKTAGSGDAKRFSDRAAKQNYDALFLMGGDGTVSEGIAGLSANENPPLFGIIPMGTVNNFARALGLSMNPQKAIEDIRDSHPKKVDVGKVNDAFFISSVSIGAIPETVHEVDSEEKSKYGSLAYIKEAMDVIQEEPLYRFELKLDDDQGWIDEYSLVLVALSNSVAGVDTVFSGATVDDGYLHLLCLKETTIREKINLIPRLLSREQEDTEKLIFKSFKKASIKVKGKDQLTSTVDGDAGPELPLKLEVLSGRLTVFVPNGK